MANPDLAGVLGPSIRSARTTAKLSQTAVADALNVEPGTIANWEHGRALPALDRLVALCVILGISLYWLLQAIDPGAARDRLAREAG